MSTTRDPYELILNEEPKGTATIFFYLLSAFDLKTSQPNGSGHQLCNIVDNAMKFINHSHRDYIAHLASSGLKAAEKNVQFGVSDCAYVLGSDMPMPFGCMSISDKGSHKLTDSGEKVLAILASKYMANNFVDHDTDDENGNSLFDKAMFASHGGYGYGLCDKITKMYPQFNWDTVEAIKARAALAR